MMRAAMISLLALMASTGAALAIDPEERLADPALETRAREISRDLRCVVCKGQSIDDSNAPVARGLRRMVRDRLLAGDSDAEVMQAVAARYGDEVLARPRWSAATAVLWIGPFLVLVLGGVAAVRFLRQSALAPDAEPLSEDERARLAEALKDPPPR